MKFIGLIVFLRGLDLLQFYYREPLQEPESWRVNFEFGIFYNLNDGDYRGGLDFATIKNTRIGIKIQYTETLPFYSLIVA